MNGYRTWLIIPLLLAITLLTVLFNYNPETSTIYPVCPLTKFTGWQCSTCGGLRAVHHLLHGNFTAAWQYNPLVLCVMVVVTIAVTCRWNTRSRKILGIVILIAMMAFTIFRNI